MLAFVTGATGFFGIHVAADYRLWVRGQDSNEMYRSNVEGTRAVLEAARKQGVRRVVYTSSVATVGFISNDAAAELYHPVKPTPGLTGAPVRSAWTGEGARPYTGAASVGFGVGLSGRSLGEKFTRVPRCQWARARFSPIHFLSTHFSPS